MELNIFQAEKDSIGFLGLMAVACKKFDEQFKHPDSEFTHNRGLNIFAGIIDNSDGELIGQQQNQIHSFNNPLLHAEQLSLKEAIERINQKRPRDEKIVSVENYYRKFLFNDPNSTDYLHTGSTIYTTLEPCPFCTSALLVVRMKRIVYIIADNKFGSAFNNLKRDYYPSYDIRYEQLNIPDIKESKHISAAAVLYQQLLEKVVSLKANNPKLYDTLLLDYLKDLLQECFNLFISWEANDLVTTGQEKLKNAKLLEGFKSKLL